MQPDYIDAALVDVGVLPDGMDGRALRATTLGLFARALTFMEG